MYVRERTALISFCLVPLVVFVGNIIHQGHRASLYLAGVCIIGAFVKNLWVRAFVWYWVAWVLLMMIMSALGNFPSLEFQKAVIATGYFAFTMMFYIAMQESTIKIDRILDVVCLAAVLQALLCVCQMWDFDPHFKFMELYASVKKTLPETEVTGTLGNNNFLAVYLAISTPFFFRRYWAYFVPVLLSIILISLTSTAVVGLLIGTVVFFKDRIKWRWIILGLIPFIVYLFVIKASLTWNFTWDHDRFHWWKSALVFWYMNWESMIFGFGPSVSWGQKFPIHNEWITALFNFGIIGLGIAVGYFVTAYRKNRHLYAAFITAAVTLNGTYPLHLAPTGMLCMITIGLMERERLNANRELHNNRTV